MSDLISRQVVIDLLKKNVSKDIEEVIVTDKNIKLIESIPTAYNVDAVVAELEKAYPINPYPNSFSNGRDLAIKKAIEIVKAGGAS